MKKLALVPAVAAASLSVPAFAQAAGGQDYSALTGAIDVGNLTTAILSVGAVVIGVSLAVLGVKKVIGLVRGA